MINQGKLLTKLNPRYERIFNILPWLGIEFYASKISMSFNLLIAILCGKISSVLNIFIFAACRLPINIMLANLFLS
jgi:hypothetical protein